MTSSSGNLHSKRLTPESVRGQRLPEVDAAQQLKLRERQRFFEEVFQHDVDVYLSSAHLCIRDYKRPPIGSVSSMEVNVDLLDQMELIEISDQESLDVFFSSVGDEPALTSPLAECRGGAEMREFSCPQPPAERGGSGGGCPSLADSTAGCTARRTEETGAHLTAVIPPLTPTPRSSQIQPSSSE